jgi:hypothetical protein
MAGDSPGSKRGTCATPSSPTWQIASASAQPALEETRSGVNILSLFNLGIFDKLHIFIDCNDLATCAGASGLRLQSSALSQSPFTFEPCAGTSATRLFGDSGIVISTSPAAMAGARNGRSEVLGVLEVAIAA